MEDHWDEMKKKWQWSEDKLMFCVILYQNVIRLLMYNIFTSFLSFLVVKMSIITEIKQIIIIKKNQFQYIHCTRTNWTQSILYIQSPDKTEPHKPTQNTNADVPFLKFDKLTELIDITWKSQWLLYKNLR